MGSGRSNFTTGKIFIGGLAKETTDSAFAKHFGKYGELTDSIIMRDRNTGLPRGFGFVTFADPSVVETVVADDHYISGKRVDVKRLIPKGCTDPVDFKTKKIFVGGIPSSVTEDEFKDFFSRYGKVVEHEITRNHVKNCGFGFIVFDSELVVDNILVNGNTIDMNGTQVEIKQAEPIKSAYTALPSYEPKKSPDTGPPSDAPKKSPDTPPPSYDKSPKAHEYDTTFSGYGDYYGEFGGVGYGPPYRSVGEHFSRFGDYGGYGLSGSEFGRRYSDFGGHYGGYRGSEPLFGHPSHFNSFSGEGLGGWRGLGGYGRDPPCYGGYSLDLPCYRGYGRDLPYYGYGGPRDCPGYEFGAGSGAGGIYHRYHPYAR